VLVKGQLNEAGKIDADPESMKVGLVTVNGVEENVKVVRNDRRGVPPFRLSVDIPRPAMTTGIAGVAYLL
jgi:solute carrier family 31 (copper transporter), member 1